MLQIEKLSLVVLASTMALVLVACDSNGANDDDDDQEFASFSLVIAGDAEASMEGYAFFGEAEDPETGEDVFVIYFSETESVTPQAGSYGFLGRNSGRPGTGSYAVVDTNDDDDDDEIPEDEFVMVVTRGTTQANAITFVSKGGTLNILASSSNRIEGDFEIDAAGFDVGAGEQLDVTIGGSFDAVGSNNVFVPFAM